METSLKYVTITHIKVCILYSLQVIVLRRRLLDLTFQFSSYHSSTSKMAPNTSRQLFPSPTGNSALEDALGGYLTGEYQAHINQAAQELRSAFDLVNQRTIERDLASQAWRDQLMRTEDIANGLEVSLQARDRLCSSLMHLVLLYASKAEVDEVDDTRIGICTRYFEELRTFAAEHYDYNCQLTPLDDIRMNVDDELAAEILRDMSTDAESDSETESESVPETEDAMDIDDEDIDRGETPEIIQASLERLHRAAWGLH